jgi:hypothetical protein
VERLQVYEVYISQQEGLGKVTRLARMAAEAAKSMLKSFPGDPLAAMQLPMVLYKAGKAEQCAVSRLLPSSLLFCFLHCHVILVCRLKLLGLLWR